MHGRSAISSVARLHPQRDLRGRPLDEWGVGLHSLNERGDCVAAAFERLSRFASPKTAADSRGEPGLNSKERRPFMHANFERGQGRA